MTDTTAKALAAPACPPGHVLAKITKAGAGKIATGRVGFAGDPDSPADVDFQLNYFHARGETVPMLVETAAIYEDRGWVEVD